MSLETIEIETGATPDAAVIWLHGLGADGHDFEPIVPELRLPGSLALRFVFPHAPVRPVTLNNGMRMRAWYDIFQLGGGPEDEAGVRASQALVENLIENENKKGVKTARIVLAGFSQGGAIALQTALRHPARLAGVLALSTYLPIASKLAAERSEANRDVPIFMAHGQHDDIIPLRKAELSREALARAGYAVDWKTYPMPHSVCAEEIGDIARALVRFLGSSP
ncbi:MAG TPA: alpha/beta fold hydrolase [Burkholderiales bacterium]|jgi:phospholipase/carboxylesterase|nr:alpha/beta fold hydrolase [Burkholderiales bacterium]